MNKILRFLAATMALAAVLSLAACAPEGNTTAGSTQGSTQGNQSTAGTTQSTAPAKKITFRVQILDEAGKAAAGVGVQLCKADGTCTIRETNAEGWAEFENPVEDGYTANIAYTADFSEVNSEKQAFASGVTEMTLTLKVTYKVKVVDAEGKAVAGETVTLVNEAKYAYSVATTDAEGYAYFYNEVNEGYTACFGDHANGKLEGVELTPFEGDAMEVTLTKQ